ncbi:PDR/VanB family oxidoreductase [Arthrobacter globiformis]|uniref:Oxidoreductase n=1 Tax=Arthrobacter globiformis TaxID=1665 RepID=A0A328HHX2_ARTGO|nr:PDR/VanB family oxidoreductase [Arthrobacter globiformis]RAM37754.1 oxidoreductase [Arthrobacter globiformis]
MTTTALEAGVHPAVQQGLHLEVTDVCIQTASVTGITFSDPTGAPLPRYVPGSHLVVQYGDGANAYSLTGSGSVPSEYTISVLRVEDGAGGSLAMHRLRIGDRVRTSRPRSAFSPVATATHHLLIAAGIGITPMLSHARAAAEKGEAVSLLYVYRPGAGAHVGEARELLGPALTECTDRYSFHEELREKLSSQQIGTHLYVCGPAAFMDTVLDAAAEQGWPKSRLHSEPFGATELDPGKPFTARLARSGTTVDVPEGVSLLEALEKTGIGIRNMCRKGVCGECSLSVLRGAPEHRDLYLTDAETAANTTIMCCVSRSLDQELELDL